MAEFSREYIDQYMPEWGGDFSIAEEAAKLRAGEWAPHICEGYGFFGIYKDDEGDIFLLFDDSPPSGGHTSKKCRHSISRIVRVDKLNEEYNKSMNERE